MARWQPAGTTVDVDWMLRPQLIDCPCRHCARGRMCRAQADRFRQFAHDADAMLSRLRGLAREGVHGGPDGGRVFADRLDAILHGDDYRTGSG